MHPCHILDLVLIQIQIKKKRYRKKLYCKKCIFNVPLWHFGKQLWSSPLTAYLVSSGLPLISSTSQSNSLITISFCFYCMKCIWYIRMAYIFIFLTVRAIRMISVTYTITIGNITFCVLLLCKVFVNRTYSLYLIVLTICTVRIIGVIWNL